MSADAWQICPKCKKTSSNKKAEAQKRADEAYGKVSPREWLALSEIAAATSPDEQEETFREDYEIYMEEDGTFNVHYRGKCRVCGFEHNFKHKEKV